MEESLTTSLIQVLVVEDFERFRRSVVSMLQRKPELQVICEASDGLEAVRKVQELQPDLVLLDIGLPSLNGIEVARQICKLSPGSKILFVSQETSSDIVQAGLAIGAKGYVVKTHARSELLIAVNAVLRGERFVSPSLAGMHSSNGKNEQTFGHPDRKKFIAPLPPQNLAIRHEVAFYADDAALVDGFAHVAKAALAVDNAVILIATAEHRSNILQKLRTNAVDVDGALINASLIQLDALDIISTLLIN